LMKERIRSTHLHDNDGRQDQHLFPGKGSINWDSAIKLLGSRACQYPLLLELKEPDGMAHLVEEARSAMDELLERMNKHEQ